MDGGSVMGTGHNHSSMPHRRQHLNVLPASLWEACLTKRTQATCASDQLSLGRNGRHSAGTRTSASAIETIMA